MAEEEEQTTSSVYPRIRPLLIFSYVTGQFSAKNVTASTASQLRAKICTPALISLVALSGIRNVVVLVTLLISETPPKEVVVILGTISVTTLIEIFLFLSSSEIIEALNALDSLKLEVALLPVEFRLHRSQYLFVSVFVLLYLGVHATIIPYLIKNDTDSSTILVLIVEFNALVGVRQTILLSCIYYSCSQEVNGIVHAIGTHFKTNETGSLNMSYILTILQNDIDNLEKVHKFLSRQVCLITIYRIVKFILRVFNVEHETDFFRRALRAIVLAGANGILYFSIEMTSVQFHTLVDEVFSITLRNVNPRDCVMIHILLSRLTAGSTDFTLNGFSKINLQFALSIMCLAVECFIMFEQNVDYIRQLMGYST